MKGITLLWLCFPIVSFLSCNELSPEQTTLDSLKIEKMADSILAETTARVAKEIGGAATWEYSQEIDKMTSKMPYLAQLMAINIVDLGFPYEGSRPYIILRNKRGSTDVMFGVTKGQLHHDYNLAPYISVRFDDAKAERYYCAEPSDGSPEVYFIAAKSRFIKHLKKAKKVWIETEFYHNGLKVMEFNCKDLVWMH